MRPNKIGQVVKFHTPYPGEEPTQRFVTSEIHLDVEKPRALIKELNGGSLFASTATVLLEDLEVIELTTAELNGQLVTIHKSDSSIATGRVVEVRDPKVMLDLTKRANGVETNVWLTILDSEGKEHQGTVLVK